MGVVVFNKFVSGFSIIFSNQFVSNLFSCLVNKSLSSLMLSGDGHFLTRAGSPFTFHSIQDLGITLTGDTIEWRN